MPIVPTILGKAFDNFLKNQGYSKEEFAYKVLPTFLLDIMQKYLRVEVEGVENLPKKGPYILYANHSGYMGFDALMLSHQVQLHTAHLPKMVAHKLWFIHPDISVHVKKLGMIPATFENSLKLLEENEPLLLFPEGEEGNFKPTQFRYRLRRFRRGIVRLAYATGVPLIPATVVGAEETHITLSQVKWAKELFGVLIPVPLNVLPLPVKWKIKFYTPTSFPKDLERAQNVKEVTKISRELRHQLQKDLHAELKKRTHLFV